MYKILEAEIAHNKRLQSGLIEQLHFTPESPYQIVIGPNGVGKSAFLDELTTYPSEGSAFDKGGYSRLRIETEEGIIETKSNFGSSGKHEFWLGGENLNEGGTSTVQKELAEKYFKMNKVNFSIVNNTFSFTGSRSASRQEILTQLGDNDMTLAFNIFNKAKRGISHSQGALNALKESLVEKETMNLSDEDMEQLQSRLDDYQDRTTRILTELQSNNTSIDITLLRLQWETLSRDIDFTVRAIPKVPLDAPNRDVWVGKINDVEEDLLRIKTYQNVLGEEFDGLSDILKRSADSSEENIGKVRGEIDYWEKERESLKAIKVYDVDFSTLVERADIAFEEVKNVFGDWRRVMEEMPSDPEGTFTRENYTKDKESLVKFRQHFNALSGKRSHALEQLQHIDNGVEVHCPNCKFHFIPGVSSDSKPRLLSNLEEYSQSLKKGEAIIEETEDRVQRIDQWLNGYRQLMGLEQLCPHGAVFFNRVKELSDFKASPVGAIGVAMELFEQLKLLAEIEKVNQKVLESKRTLKSLEENTVAGIEEIRERHHKVNGQLTELTTRRVDLERSLSGLVDALKEADSFCRRLDETVDQYEITKNTAISYIDGQINLARKVILSELQGHIGTLTKTLNEVKSLRAQIDDTRKQIGKQEKRLAGFKRIVNSLSPKSGLIAEQMNEFVTNFIGQMNEVIADVWTYPMEIMVGKPNDTELTYTFPVMLHGDPEKVAPDISETSDGQKSFIDFAFKVTAMLNLGLINVPISLDEVDRPLEPAHKERLMKFISEAVENERFSQVFLVSHHAISHGALPYSDVNDFNYANPEPGSNKTIKFW